MRGAIMSVMGCCAAPVGPVAETPSTTISTPAAGGPNDALTTAVAAVTTAVTELSNALQSGADPTAAIAAGQAALSAATTALTEAQAAIGAAALTEAPASTVAGADGGGAATATSTDTVGVGGASAETLAQLDSTSDPLPESDTAAGAATAPAADALAGTSDSDTSAPAGGASAVEQGAAGASGCSCHGGTPAQTSTGGAAGAPEPALGGPSVALTDTPSTTTQTTKPATTEDDSTSALRKKILDIARGELGVRESEGKDQDPRIREYRRSVIGKAGDKPAWWCAYFVSWVFNQAGAPIVDNNGAGLSMAIGNWGKKTGRFSAPGSTPKPGDIVLFKNETSSNWANHIGIVESVDANGKIHTIEGNISDKVARATRKPSGDGIVGFVSAT